MYSVGNIVNNYVISLYGDISYQAYRGDDFEVYKNIESLCCVTGTNIVLQVYTSKTNKQSHRKRDQISSYQR